MTAPPGEVRFVQIAVNERMLYGLDAAGQVWLYYPIGRTWERQGMDALEPPFPLPPIAPSLTSVARTPDVR